MDAELLKICVSFEMVSVKFESAVEVEAVAMMPPPWPALQGTENQVGGGCRQCSRHQQQQQQGQLRCRQQQQQHYTKKWASSAASRVAQL
jgi:hypothetical protein